MIAIDIISLASSLMSLVLGGFSIWLAFQFYSKGKDAEKETSSVLSEIRVQAEMLSKITGRQLDRLTKYVTTNRHNDDSGIALLTAVQNLPNKILASLHPPPPADPLADADPALVTDLVGCYIMLYWYTGISNLLGQECLPDRIENATEAENTILQFVDTSATDFAYMKQVISKVDPRLVETNPYNRYFLDAERVVVQHVRDYYRASPTPT